MDGFKYTHTITLPDGSAAEHTSEALAYAESGDGGIVVIAACCGQVGGVLCDECNGLGCACCGQLGITPIAGVPDTRSRHTFYDIGMPVSDGKGGILPPIDPADEIKKHVQSVAERHAARTTSKMSLIAPLVRSRGKSPAPDKGAPSTSEVGDPSTPA
jgi:hypothetical protein